MANIEIADNPLPDDITAEVKDVENTAVAVHVEDEYPLPHDVQYLHIDEAVQKQVVQKLDWNIMPIVIALCTPPVDIPQKVPISEIAIDLCSILDRGNIGNAQLASMSVSLKMSSGQYQCLLTIFYIPYILFELGGFMVPLAPHLVSCEIYSPLLFSGN